MDAGVNTPARPAADAADQPKLGYAWYVVLVLMICYTLSFVDRQILAFLVGPLKQDLGISDTQIGLLQGLAFAVFYTFLGLPMGLLADRFSRRNIIVVGVLVWSFMTTISAGAKSFFSLSATRMGVGVGEATLGPCAMSLISDYFPRERLSSALSVYAMGIALGSGLAMIVGGLVVQAVMSRPPVEVPLLGTLAPWRLTFLIVGIPGVLIALLMFTVREPMRRALLRSADGQVAKLRFGEIVEQLRARWQSILCVSLAMACQSMSNYALGAWGPTFFDRVHQWPRSKAGLVLGTLTIVFSCLGLLVGGRMSDRWQRQGVHEATLRVGLISVIGVFCTLVPAMMVSSAMLTVLLLAPALFFLGLPIGSTYASLQMIVPNQVRGMVSAISIFILNLGGLGLGPLLPGLFNDQIFADGNKVGHSIALTVAIAAISGALLFRAAYGPYRRHYALMHAQ